VNVCELDTGDGKKRAFVHSVGGSSYPEKKCKSAASSSSPSGVKEDEGKSPLLSLRFVPKAIGSEVHVCHGETSIVGVVAKGYHLVDDLPVALRQAALLLPMPEDTWISQCVPRDEPATPPLSRAIRFCHVLDDLGTEMCFYAMTLHNLYAYMCQFAASPSGGDPFGAEFEYVVQQLYIAAAPRPPPPLLPVFGEAKRSAVLPDASLPAVAANAVDVAAVPVEAPEDNTSEEEDNDAAIRLVQNLAGDDDDVVSVQDILATDSPVAAIRQRKLDTERATREAEESERAVIALMEEDVRRQQQQMRRFRPPAAALPAAARGASRSSSSTRITSEGARAFRECFNSLPEEIRERFVLAMGLLFQTDG
jgi:hypothetical protein